MINRSNKACAADLTSDGVTTKNVTLACLSISAGARVTRIIIQQSRRAIITARIRASERVSQFS